jgi:hypothetical protein
MGEIQVFTKNSLIGFWMRAEGKTSTKTSTEFFALNRLNSGLFIMAQELAHILFQLAHRQGRDRPIF